MNLLRHLNLKTKLIGSFIFLAVIIVSFSLIVPRLTIMQMVEKSIPLVLKVGKVEGVAHEAQDEVMEFVVSGEDEAAAEFYDAAGELDDLSRQLESELTADTPEAANLVRLSVQLNALGQKIINNHRQTITAIADLGQLAEEIEEKSEESPANAASPPPIPGQPADEIQALRLRMINEVFQAIVGGDPETEDEFDAIALRLQTARQALEKTGQTDSTKAFIEASAETEAACRATLESHQATQTLLAEFEQVEQELQVSITSIQRWVEQITNTTISAGRTALLISAGIILGVAVLLGLATTKGILTPVYQLTEAARQIGAGNLTVQAAVETGDEIGELARIFNNMTTQLRAAFTQAEQQSQQRIRELEVTAQISRQLMTVMEVDELLRQVVNSIQQVFGYYHVHIYIIDQNTGELVMREGTGEVGQHLKAQQHRLNVGQGIVGRVAGSGEPFITANVAEAPEFIRNPLLPKTQAELAVPVRKGNATLGVLDMQSEEIGGFSQTDLVLMQSIAGQVAVAIENARLFRQARQSAAEAEALNRRLTREAWYDISHKTTTAGYVFTKTGGASLQPAAVSVADAHESWTPLMTQAAQEKKLVTSAANGLPQATVCVSIPLVLRDEVIGVIGIERAAASAGKTAQAGELNPWTEDELTTIQTIAEQVALALDTARLSHETQRAAWRDRMVSESTAKVWETAEMEEVMRTAVSQLGDRLRASEVVIRLVKEDELLRE